jgi:hypothetical protein
MENGKRRKRRQLSPEEQWEAFLEVTSHKLSQADEVRGRRVVIIWFADADGRTRRWPRSPRRSRSARRRWTRSSWNCCAPRTIGRPRRSGSWPSADVAPGKAAPGLTSPVKAGRLRDRRCRHPLLDRLPAHLRADLDPGANCCSPARWRTRTCSIAMGCRPDRRRAAESWSRGQTTDRDDRDRHPTVHHGNGDHPASGAPRVITDVPLALLCPGEIMTRGYELPHLRDAPAVHPVAAIDAERSRLRRGCLRRDPVAPVRSRWAPLRALLSFQHEHLAAPRVFPATRG